MNLEELFFFSHGKSNSCRVAIGYCGTENFKVVNTARDKNGQMLILDAELNGANLLLIKFWNSNILKSEQLSTFSTLQKRLEKFDDYNKKNVVFGGDFNLIFDCKFDASGRNPILKKISSETNWDERVSLFVWHLENKKS